MVVYSKGASSCNLMRRSQIAEFCRQAVEGGAIRPNAENCAQFIRMFFQHLAMRKNFTAQLL